jgi:hypothetical protein
MRRPLFIATLLLCWLLPTASGVAASATAADDGEDRIVLVGSVLVDRDDTAGDIVVFDGDVTIRGEVTGDVVAFGGDVTIRGVVAGDVVTFAGQATLGRRARVGGDVVYADERPVQTPGSQVGGDVKRFDLGDASIVAAIGFWIAFSVSLLLLGLIFLLLAPRAGDAIAATSRSKPLIAALVGLLAFFLLPLIAFVAFVTIVGIPLGVVLLLAILPLYALGYVATALVLGGRILKRGRILAFVVGLLILQVVTLIPFVGGLVGFLAVIFGLGLLVMTVLRARTQPPAAARA